MTTQIEAMKMALDVLIFVATIYTDRTDQTLEKPITALHAAIEAAEKVERDQGRLECRPQEKEH